MKVYLVVNTDRCSSYWFIVAIYSTRELAQKTLGRGDSIEEYEVVEQ